MRYRLASLGMALAALTVSAAASAASTCGAPVHSRFGETRAYFDNALGACRPGGYCSVVLALPAPDDVAAYAQQLRIARPEPGAPHVFELVAVEPMNDGDGTPMSLRFGRTVLDISNTAVLPPQQANLFRIDDTGTVQTIVDLMRRSRTVRWRYRGTEGRTDAWFALGGVSRALRWIDCMGRR